jgi:predicted nuclease of restriction endonuclease-like RecB superfamily
MLLSSEFLVVSKRNDIIKPKFVEFNGDNLALASNLIDVYKTNVGERKKTLKEAAASLEFEGYDYRLVRGLSFLLDARSKFKSNDSVSSESLRRQIFHIVAEQGIPTLEDERTQIITSAASQLNLPIETIEENLYADLDDELILETLNPVSPRELVLEYNLSLAQTILFDSVELTFTASGNWQRIFRAIKSYGLIHGISKDENGGIWVKVDGPASLFKLTRRYGTGMAKLLPVIVASPSWLVKAKILWKFNNTVYNFDLDNLQHGAILRKPNYHDETYDSTVESDFAARFQALQSGWLMKREPEPIPVGNHVMIPDFSLEKDGEKVFVEIVGFWTEEYLLRKICKLSKTDEHIIVAVNEGLACDQMKQLENHRKLTVIYYRNKVPLAPILNHLQEISRTTQAKQTAQLENTAFNFTEEIISFNELATKLGVSTEAITKVIQAKPPQDYVILASGLIRKSKLEEIRKKLEQSLQHKRLRLSEAEKIIAAEGVKDHTSTLNALGFKVIWRDINADNAEIQPKPP